MCIPDRDPLPEPVWTTRATEQTVPGTYVGLALVLQDALRPDATDTSQNFSHGIGYSED